MILLVSHRDDDHAHAVHAELTAAGVEAVMFDTAAFPQRATLALGYATGQRSSLLVGDAQGAKLDLGDVSAAWWRRPRPFELDSDLPEDEIEFTYNECFEAVSGLWASLEAFWVNDPRRDQVASHKPYQLKVASAVGLRIPPTLITNDPDEARAFIEARGVEHTVYKCFAATPRHWRETRVMRTQEVALLDRVRAAPVIFQQFVPAEADVRVTIVGDACFPAAIRPRSSAYDADFRMDLASAAIEPTTLPEEVEWGLRALMGSLGLVYGAVDLRRTPTGEHVFLEINTSGQWRFVEERTEQPITAAVARTLAQAATAAPTSLGATQARR